VVELVPEVRVHVLNSALRQPTAQHASLGQIRNSAQQAGVRAASRSRSESQCAQRAQRVQATAGQQQARNKRTHADVEDHARALELAPIWASTSSPSSRRTLKRCTSTPSRSSAAISRTDERVGSPRG